MYYLYNVKDQSLTKVTKPKDEKFLEFACKQVDCRMVDFVSLTDDIDIVCDDEGLLRRSKDINIIRDKSEYVELKIAGNLLFAGFEFETGETLELTDSQMKYIRENVGITTLSPQLFTVIAY